MTCNPRKDSAVTLSNCESCASIECIMLFNMWISCTHTPLQAEPHQSGGRNRALATTSKFSEIFIRKTRVLSSPPSGTLLTHNKVHTSASTQRQVSASSQIMQGKRPGLCNHPGLHSTDTHECTPSSIQNQKKSKTELTADQNHWQAREACVAITISAVRMAGSSFADWPPCSVHRVRGH